MHEGIMGTKAAVLLMQQRQKIASCGQLLNRLKLRAVFEASFVTFLFEHGKRVSAYGKRTVGGFMDRNRLLIIAAAVVVALLIIWYLQPGSAPTAPTDTLPPAIAPEQPQ
jgi:uncharacterized membrane protein YhhN